MDNMVQNIKIEEIIPNESVSQKEDNNEINDLTSFIRKYGITEPILVKPRNGKYEIVLGNQKYQVAKILGLQSIPAIIQKETLKKSPPPEKTNYITSIINDVNEKNDIINLSELNKEEERDEFNMNNQEMQMPNTNNGVNQQEPTFGGRFFPSLEDEPTNMNMGGMNIVGDTASNEIIQNASTIPSQSTNEFVQNQNMNQFELPQNPIPNPTEIQPEPINMPQMDNVGPVAETPQTPQFQEPQPTMNNQPTQTMQPEPSIGPEMSNINQSQNIPQFDMSQNIAPNDFSQVEQSTVDIPQLNNFNAFSAPNPGPTFETPTPSIEPNIAPNETNSQKDVEPVINAIKTLATSLQSFGYNMNVSEEDAGTSIKVTIEVLK